MSRQEKPYKAYCYINKNWMPCHTQRLEHLEKCWMNCILNNSRCVNAPGNGCIFAIRSY